MNKLEADNSPVGRLLPEDQALQSRQSLPGRVRKSKSHTLARAQNCDLWMQTGL